MKSATTLLRLTQKAPRLILALAFFAPAVAVYAQDPAIVGEATLVIGVAKLVGVDGIPRVVDRGTAIRVGDRIETQAGGHVHLRFVDGGRLSIRPVSTLQVEDYSHSDRQPALGAIKFRLDEGVVRSITGAWGEAARDRFRLNTPVAAIGVKGTDFVVRSDGEKTSASVYTGAIMLTPLAGACSNSVGPCLNGSEKLLSEDMKGQMLELSRQQATPQLVPLVDLLARAARPAAGSDMAARVEKPLTLDDTHTEAQASKNLVTDNRAISVVAAIPAAPPVEMPPVVVAPPAVEVPPAVVVVAPPVIAPPVELVFVPPVVVPLLPPEVKQLVWGRFFWTRLMDSDTFTRSIEQALATGHDRLPGNNNYTLFRPPPASPGAVLASADASASFRLASSSAQLVRNEGKLIEPVSVSDGTFNVDFTRSTFATELRVTNPTIGTDTVAASGAIKSNGVLQAASGNVALNGALTLDGKEAGYAFDKALNAGTLRGVTLWGR